MTQSFDFSKMELSFLNSLEMSEIDGGGFLEWLGVGGVISIIAGIVTGSLALMVVGGAALYIINQ
ncbi:MAG: hypothetical protein H7Z13_01510 [Ferruginibacter sp.]|nr:hypothetical protein [Ferruginibacter sp.]